MILLDTSLLIQALVPNSPADRQLRGWMRDGVSLGISVIAWAEFLCGPVGKQEIALADRLLPVRIPFTDEDAPLAAHLFNLGGRRRGTLIDCMVAAVAVRSKVVLATLNPQDFRRFEPAGLRLLST